ncbi:4'-phosphopantetheinyl transferase superfamily protein [Psychromonas sp. RZ22]|uniref:4'-phosphopantetheinyl transferase family protein n=1 Tax=Psychromonas algarum TaxID=2555643 RepID=UPI0010673773|nr:4'-phosphopantetheinyl transferase superfamily protein [Psychromonas sp. RZ22]TEW55972.1 4'-phosphopantetheinyl transferase superfamily protein [Psychromonas sp. RZ22]
MHLLLSSLQALEKNHIDLWFIDPNTISAQSIQDLSSVLSHSEAEKLAQYKNKSAQHTALVTRSISRIILANYTQLSASEISFVRNQHGKPELEKNINNVQFNLSHNHHLIVMAVCVNDDIGCDIESPLRKVNIEPITRRYFSKQEHKQLIELNDEKKQQRFFELWTLKEAFVKATGVGISLGLDTFHFSFNKNKLTSNINLAFNSHYPLDKNVQWQLYQAAFKNQMLAICRANELPQNVNFLDASQLIKKSK